MSYHLQNLLSTPLEKEITSEEMHFPSSPAETKILRAAEDPEGQRKTHDIILSVPTCRLQSAEGSCKTSSAPISRLWTGTKVGTLSQGAFTLAVLMLLPTVYV